MPLNITNIRAYWECFKYIMLHKWHVFWECRALGVGVWQALVHDMSKLSWIEFYAYTQHFYMHDHSPKGQYLFDMAWLHHIHQNPHHWQHFILQTDEEGIRVLPMPDKYVREMVADWRGVGLALGKGSDHAVTWYHKNKNTLALHPKTRTLVEELLGVTEICPYRHIVPHPVYREPGS